MKVSATIFFLAVTVSSERVDISLKQQQDILTNAFGPSNENGRSAYSGLSEYRSSLETRIKKFVKEKGWLPARVLAKAISVSADLDSLKMIKVQGRVTACHGAPVCLDLACGKCFDPLTSM